MIAFIIGMFVFCLEFEKTGVVIFCVVAYLMIKDGTCKSLFRDPDKAHQEYQDRRYEELKSDPHYEYLREHFRRKGYDVDKP